MDIIQVNKATCRQDGICAAVCPGGLIEYKKNEFPRPGPFMGVECIKCGHCVAACPTGALTHRDMPVEKCPPMQKELLLITPEQYEHIFRSRRSARIFKNQPVSRDLITRLIEIARYAPTGHNAQTLEWIVIDDQNELARLGNIGLEWMRWMLRESKQLAAFLGAERILKRWENEKYNEILRHAPVFIAVHSPESYDIGFADCIGALTYFDLASRSFGLSCCLCGFVYLMYNSFPPMKEALKIPKGRKAHGFLMVGYPKYSYQRLPLRNPPKITWR